MPSPLFHLLKRCYLSLSRFSVVRAAREWWLSHVQLHWWPWYNLPPRACGVEENPHAYKHELIVSLTSFPARMHFVHHAVGSLLKQSLKPNRVVLWLGEEQFPHKEEDLPDKLLKLKEFGLEIRWCKDVKALTKSVYAFQTWPDAIIVTADDDYHYPHHWLQSLYQSYLTNEAVIHTGVVHQIRFSALGEPEPFEKWSWHAFPVKPLFCNVHNGSSGALYPPHCLHPDIFDIPMYLRLSPSNDDLWIWTMAVRAGTRIQLVQENRQNLVLNPKFRETPRLWVENTKGGGNTRCFFNLFEAFPDVGKQLREEWATQDYSSRSRELNPGE